MKKIVCLLFAFLLLFSCFSLTAFAADPEDAVYVTVCDKYGTIVVYYYEVELTDVDEDGVTTVYDVLYTTHEEACRGGAARGFAASEDHKELLRLWGYAGNPFGCYVNHESTDTTSGAIPKPNLLTPVKPGDYIVAFMYRDATTLSDMYTFFDRDCVTLEKGESVTLTLRGYTLDENYEMQTVIVAGAPIVIDGTVMPYTTDENGQVTLTFDNAEEYTVSAKSMMPDGRFIVSAVCHVNQEGTYIAPVWWTLFAVAELFFVLGMVLLFLRMQKKRRKHTEQSLG